MGSLEFPNATRNSAGKTIKSDTQANAMAKHDRAPNFCNKTKSVVVKAKKPMLNSNDVMQIARPTTRIVASVSPDSW